MKKLILLAMLLAISLAAPALAQEGTVPDGSQAKEGTTQEEGTVQDRPPAKEGTEEEEPADGPPGPPPGEETATLTFELTVEGTPPADATFFGNLQTGEGGPGSFTPLTDPDGDGLYTGSTTAPRFGPGPRPVPPGVEPLSFGVEIVQGTGTQGSVPGQPITTIRDFGAVPMNDQTFEASVSFPDNGGGPGGPGDTATVTFELTIDGEVPDGKSLGVDTGIADMAQPVFCSTIDFDRGSLPVCEDGETYSDTFEISAGSSLLYEYAVFDLGYGGVVETFAADSRTFTEDETVSATYRPGDPGNNQEIVEASGVLERPEATTYQYGTHTITDEASETLYALQSNIVDLDDYVGEEVTIYGALTPGYEDGQVEGGPPLMDVYTVVPVNGPPPGAEAVTATFELTVEGQPPAGTKFFGIAGEGGGPLSLTDPDGDGLYTVSARIVSGQPTRLLIGQDNDNAIKIIQDFGQVKLDEDETFRASVSFKGGGGGTTPGNGGSSGGGYLGGIADGIRNTLPNTGGGMALTVLGAGAALISGGLLVRRIFR